jgi:hypothetical protein
MTAVMLGRALEQPVWLEEWVANRIRLARARLG